MTNENDPVASTKAGCPLGDPGPLAILTHAPTEVGTLASLIPG